MPHTTHDTTTPEPRHSVDPATDEWTKEVIPRLPSAMADQAKARKRL